MISGFCRSRAREVLIQMQLRIFFSLFAPLTFHLGNVMWIFCQARCNFSWQNNDFHVMPKYSPTKQRETKMLQNMEKLTGKGTDLCLLDFMVDWLISPGCTKLIGLSIGWGLSGSALGWLLWNTARGSFLSCMFGITGHVGCGLVTGRVNWRRFRHVWCLWKTTRLILHFCILMTCGLVGPGLVARWEDGGYFRHIRRKARAVWAERREVMQVQLFVALVVFSFVSPLSCKGNEKYLRNHFDQILY